MAFPFEFDTQEDDYKKELDEPCEFEIDFETGQLTGRKVTGLEAIKTWVYIALRITRYRNLVFSWDFGNELEDLIGKGYSLEYLETEVPRMITECLLINPYISDITNFEIYMDSDKLNVCFKILTLYGNEVINLNV